MCCAELALLSPEGARRSMIDPHNPLLIQHCASSIACPFSGALAPAGRRTHDVVPPPPQLLECDHLPYVTLHLRGDLGWILKHSGTGEARLLEDAGRDFGVVVYLASRATCYARGCPACLPTRMPPPPPGSCLIRATASSRPGHVSLGDRASFGVSVVADVCCMYVVASWLVA